MSDRHDLSICKCVPGCGDAEPVPSGPVTRPLKQGFAGWIDRHTAQRVETYRDAARDMLEELPDFCQCQQQRRMELEDARATATVSSKGSCYGRGNPETPSLKLDGPARMFPTPSVSDTKGFDGPNKASPSKNWETYSRLAPMTSSPRHECSPKCRRLNPLFVERLMGWPGGWTLLPTGLRDFESSETEWSRWWQLMRSALSRLRWG